MAVDWCNQQGLYRLLMMSTEGGRFPAAAALVNE